MKIHSGFTYGFLWILSFVFVSVVSAGSLNPPGAPAPTMKPLDEVEPRIPINSENTPGDMAALYVISEPGSYYLTDNITISFRHAIRIDAADVTLDLMGYRLWSAYMVIPPGATTSFDGIHISADAENVEIRNGTIASDNHTSGLFTYRGFRHGIYAAGKQIRVMDMRVCGSRQNGIELNDINNLVKNCTVSGNGTASTEAAYGIYASDGSSFIGNTVSENGASSQYDVYGICGVYNCIARNNMVYKNGDSATGAVYGLNVDEGGTVTGNTVYGNGRNATGTIRGMNAASGSTVIGNTVHTNGDGADGNVFGISAGPGSVVTSNTSYYNGIGADSVYGFGVSEGCTFTGNTARDNGDSATGLVYGVLLSSSCLVDQNTIYSNGTGVVEAINMDLAVSGCVYGKNVAP